MFVEGVAFPNVVASSGEVFQFIEPIYDLVALDCFIRLNPPLIWSLWVVTLFHRFSRKSKKSGDFKWTKCQLEDEEEEDEEEEEEEETEVEEVEEVEDSSSPRRKDSQNW